MKNRMYISLLFMLAFLPACNAQENETAKTMLEEFNLKGKVKTVTIIYEQEEKSHKLHFDENGNLVKQENSYVWEGTRGEIHDNYIYENGKLLSYDVHRVFKSPPTLFLGKGCFEYDSRGLLIGSDAYFDDKNVYKYDRKGNRIERYGFLKTRQKHNEKGQIIEEWHFEDKETEVRKFGVTDAQGNHFPDEIHVLPPFELAPNVYEYNEHGDVSGITDMAKSNPVKDIITLKYDEQGNWIERTAHGSAMFNECLTTEQIYTRIFYNHEHIRREIEYYELTADSDTLSRVIVQVVEAYLNRNEDTLNALAMLDFGIAALYRRGVSDNISILEKFSFDDPEPEYLPYNTDFEIDYTVYFEELPVFSHDDFNWSKPGGIYCDTTQTDYSLSSAAKAENMAFGYAKWSDGRIAELEELERRSHKIIAVGKKSEEFIFYLTFHEGAWYLSSIDRNETGA